MTSATRWNVDYPTNSSEAVSSSIKYNTAGAVVSMTTPWDGVNTRTIKIGYSDNFNSNPGVTTWAYPTSVTDPANISSTVEYRYDIGTNVEANSPAPTGQTYGKTTKWIYDAIGRLERDSIYIGSTEHTYTRYEFPTNGIQSKSYSTLVDTDNDGADADDEVLSESWADGAGRVRFSRVPHTSSGGSTETWAGTITEYDVLGRVKRQSVPTETDSSFNPTGVDYRGMIGNEYIWLWTHQKYDWMGRVVRKINTDGADSPTLNDSDVLISYEGCGCAGGLVTTIEGELLPRTDTTGHGRRKTNIHEDILGRVTKRFTFSWNGDVYQTSTNSYNGRDQVIASIDYSGGESTSNPHQTTTMSYDGHGRLKTSRRPEQTADSTYNYNPDDSILSVVDARGATTNYTYTNRGQVEGLSWTVPNGSGIEDPADVSFIYDNLGNRTSMTDGLGEMFFDYNPLSQRVSESRYFSDLPSAPFPNNRYTLTYTYTLGGQLKSYTDPAGRNIEYTADRVGRLSEVKGTFSSNVTTYASNPEYRAWGALTRVEYGNGTEMNAGAFNNRLQATEFEIKKNTTQIIAKEYEFYSDGSMKKETDELNDKFDRLYTYDHVGRMHSARSGINARGQTGNALYIPFKNDFQYDAFNNQTQNQYAHFTRNGVVNLGYTNNRITNWGPYNSASVYDADGNLTTNEPSAPNKVYIYDAAGRMSGTTHGYNEGQTNIIDLETLTYDGNGLLAKTATSHQVDDEDPELETTFSVRSSVMQGEIVSKVNQAGGGIMATYIRAAGTVVAIERAWGGPAYMHKAPMMTSTRATDSSGQVISYGNSTDDFQPHELDPSGKSIGFDDPYANGIPDPQPELFQMFESYGELINGQWTTATQDGMQVPLSAVRRAWDGKEMLLSRYLALLSTGDTGRWSEPAFRIKRIDGTGGDIGIIDEDGTATYDGWESTSLPHHQVLFAPTWSIGNVLAGLFSPLARQTPDLKVLESATGICASQLFGVNLTSVQWSRTGVNGEMKFSVPKGQYVPNYGNSRLFHSGAKTFSVYNDATSYASSSNQMKKGAILGFAYGYGNGYLETYGIYQFDSGRTGKKDWTNRTYTASDASGSGAVQNSVGMGLGFSTFNHVQIHEAGNALSKITGKFVAHDGNRNLQWQDATGQTHILNDDDDNGQVFEKCVFVNYRRLKGLHY